MMASIGTKTGKIRHEPSQSAGVLGYALCGKMILNVVWQAEPANCRRCVDERDVRAVQASHLLTLAPVCEGSLLDMVTATCSCGHWSARGDTAAAAVDAHRQHMLAVARAPKG